MVRVKQFMGFLLLATLLFLAWVLGAQRGLEAIIWTSCFLLVAEPRLLDERRVPRPDRVRRGARSSSIVLMLVLVLGSGWYFIGEKFAAAKTARRETARRAVIGSRLRRSVCEAELEQGHAVFVDFTAAWCITCKFNEATVLESAAVREAFQRHGSGQN